MNAPEFHPTNAILRTMALIAVVFFLSLRCASSAEESTPPVLDEDQKKTVEKLIQDFDSSDFVARERAGSALKEIGVGAIQQLNQALEGDISPDASFRIRRTIEAIKVAELLKDPVDLEKIFEETTKAVNGDLDKETIGAMLVKLVTLLKEQTGKESLRLPVTFEDVKEEAGSKNTLIIGDTVQQTSVLGCIVLASDSARFTGATDSIIICGGDVKITGAKNCIVLTRGVSQTTSIRGGINLAGEATNATSVQDAVVGATGSTKFTSIRGTSVLVNSPSNDRAVRSGIGNLELESLFLPKPNSSTN